MQRVSSRLRRLRRDESGAVIPIVVLSFIALIGMVVISVDVGGIVVQRRYMVNANDSAALAAAQAYALKQDAASCGVYDTPAIQEANRLADANVSGSTPVSYQTNCEEQTVAVQYSKPQELFFAPALGFGNTATVAATATARWGASQGGSPMPVELDPNLVDNCVYVDPATQDEYKPPGACPTGFWLNNGDLTASGWGLIDLTEWGVPWDSTCNDAGSSGLGGWIDQSQPISVSLQTIPTYACTTDGHRDQAWFDQMYAQIGKIFLFPVNDPAQMVVTNPWLPTQRQVNSTSAQKYAIISFAPMLLKDLLKGNDSAAIGTPGTNAQTGNCGGNGTALALDGAGQRNLGNLADTSCGGPDYLSNASRYHVPFSSVVVTSGTGNNKVTYKGCPPTGGVNCDYVYNEDNTNTVSGIPPLTLSWVDPTTRGVPKTVKLDWTVDGTPGTPGACGIRPSDPNAVCLVLDWAGPQLIGTDPGPGSGPAQTIQLIK